MTIENGRSIRPGACPERIERPNSAIQPFDFSQRGHRPVPKDAGRPKPIGLRLLRLQNTPTLTTGEVHARSRERKVRPERIRLQMCTVHRDLLVLNVKFNMLTSPT